MIQNRRNSITRQLAFLTVNASIRGMTSIVCRINKEELDAVPAHGPLIIITNHINFLEVPLLYTHLMPRPLTGFAKVETWDNPLLAWLFDLWGAIPIHRGEADTKAMRLALKALEENRIVALAPEGTRSGHGRLQEGKPGVTMLALLSGAPILPVVFYGNEHFKHNITRLRRTTFNIVVGRQFYLDAHGEKPTRKIRQQMTKEIMYQMAALLPPEYRGLYADLENATQTYLRFKPAK